MPAMRCCGSYALRELAPLGATEAALRLSMEMLDAERPAHMPEMVRSAVSTVFADITDELMIAF